MSSAIDCLRLARRISRNDDVIVSGVRRYGFTPERYSQFGREKHVLGLVFGRFPALLL